MINIFRVLLSFLKRRASGGWLDVFRKVFRHKVIPVETRDLSQDDIIIVLIGPTGAGKSNFISKATGTDVGVGHGLKSFTTEVHSFRSQYMERSDLDVVFVDTPGFDDTYRSDREIIDMIIDWLENTYKRGAKLSGILYFHRISDPRVPGTLLTHLDMFEKLCGENGLQNVVFITTMWDHPGVDKETAIRREKELKEKHWKGMIEAGSKVAHYDNTWDSAWDIIDDILEQANQMYATKLQTEMAETRKQVSGTSRGKELYKELEELFKQQQDVLKMIRAAIKQHKKEPRLNALRQEYEKLREQLRKKVADMQKLNLIPIGSGLQRRFETRIAW